MLFADRKIVLASASPRRLAILRQLGITPQLYQVDIDEYSELNDQTDAKSLVVKNAVLKAIAASEHYDDAIVLGADTVVVLEDTLFGKPGDEEEARGMLTRLSGKTHQVFTGICLIDRRNDKSISGAQMTEVSFHRLSSLEIDEYIKTKEPLDKAGAYGIQGLGALFVDKINGDYYGVMGLSVSLLKKLGMALMSD